MSAADSSTNKAATGSFSLPDDMVVLNGDISLALLDHMLNGVAYCRMLFDNGKPHDFIYLYTNPAFHLQTGLGPVSGKRVSEIIPGIREFDPQLFEIYGRVAAGGAPESFEIFVESLKQWFAVQVFSPRPEHFAAIFDVITERKQSEQALTESENRFSLFMDTLPAAAFIKDEDGTTLYANRYMSDVLGARAWLGKSTRDLFPPELAEKMIADDRRSLEAGYLVTEEQVPGTDGKLRFYQTHKFRISRQGQSPLLGGIAVDITERKQMEDQIFNLAYFDPLTDLPNRRMLLDRLAQALSLAKRNQRSLAVMFLDLDNFKKINDALGHDIGDELLKEVAIRLRACVRAGDTVSRQGGDEFIIILTEISHPDDAALVAGKIINTINTPVQIAGNTLNVTTSIGIAVYPINGSDDTKELMKKADKAMYAVKASGRNGFRFFAD